MSCNQFYNDLPISSAGAAQHYSEVLLKELSLIYSRYPERHDAAKACLKKARSFPLGNQNRIVWEACAENFRKGKVPA